MKPYPRSPAVDSPKTSSAVAQPGRKSKAGFNDIGGQRNKFFGDQCLFDRLPLAMQSDFLSQERVCSVSNEHAVGQKFPLRVSGRDADDGPVFPEEIDHGEFRVDLGPGLLCLLGVPAVEGRA